MKALKLRITTLFESVVDIEAVLLALVDTFLFSFCLFRCLAQYIVDIVLHPQHIRDVLTLQRFWLEKECLFVPKLLAQLNFILLKCHRPSLEHQICRPVLSWNNFIFEFKIIHFSCNSVRIPLKNISLIDSQVL